MSLQVWLPLNGDLKNQGLTNYNLSMFRGTEVYNDNGKIGKCFYANGVNTIKILNIISDFYNYTSYSLCAWFYIEAQNTAHTGSAIISGGNWNYEVLNLAVSDWSSDHYTRLRVSNTNWTKTYSYNFSLNTWYHVVVSSDGNKTYAYVNGQLIGNTVAGFLPTSISGNDICIGGATYNGNMQFFGRINDVRIYDHCLSQKEVEELSKCLVVHYHLDNVYNNIIYDSSGYQNDATVVGTYTMNNTPARFLQAISMDNTSSANRIACNKVINLPTTGITVSFWAYTTKTKSQVLYIDQYMSFAINSGGTAFYVSRTSAKGYPISYFPIGQWNHVVLVRAGTTYTVYINGVVVPQTVDTSTNWTHNVSNIYLLNRSYNNTYAANASIADFREYATALTEEQVLDLYNTSVTIDNKGNIYAREYIEDNDNLNITKTGLFQSNIIHDDDSLNVASILKTTKQIQGNTLYEY